MPCYCDDARMSADTRPELEAMAKAKAKAIGAKPARLSRSGFPHYQLTRAMRERAVEAGAADLDRHEFWQVMIRLRSSVRFQAEWDHFDG